ncbi:Aste57867_12142 [Aphanomyces stellatus]|uniref:Aste57867_12142 protein n=1 Tax=Aphanomyces stellatus TaxID=120398 RepID=A0A485KUR4_9STRA|nr:hypothetical protein As57867_012097 [Aphanomyces stellatus]VFT88996.1 Aste57867_12142 [Aphanomyces stellatus]
MEATMLRTDRALESLHRRVDALERNMNSIPHRVWACLDANLRPPPSGIEPSHVLKVAMKSFADSIVRSVVDNPQGSAVQSSVAATSRRQDGRIGSLNPRAVPDTWVSLAKQKGHAPPPPKQQPQPSPTSTTPPPPTPSQMPPPPPAGTRTSATPPPIDDNFVPELHFKWADGSIRRAAQDWSFPMTTSRVMWEYWFQGCAEPRMGPFRNLRQRDLSSASNRVQISQARGVMKKLVEIAVAHRFVGSPEEIEEMPRFKCMAIFDQAYGVLGLDGNEYLTEPLRPDRAAVYPYRHVYELLVKQKHKTGLDVHGNVCTEDATDCAMVPWLFPSTTTKAMWVFWFKGDAEHEIGPFRHLRSRDVDRFANDRRPRKLLSSARVLMERLIDIVLSNRLAESIEDLDEMDAAGLEAVFLQAFERLLDDGTGNGKALAKKALKYTYTTVYHTMTPAQRKRAREEADEPTDAATTTQNDASVAGRRRSGKHPDDDDDDDEDDDVEI